MTKNLNETIIGVKLSFKYILPRVSRWVILGFILFSPILFFSHADPRSVSDTWLSKFISIDLWVKIKQCGYLCYSVYFYISAIRPYLINEVITLQDQVGYNGFDWLGRSKSVCYDHATSCSVGEWYIKVKGSEYTIWINLKMLDLNQAQRKSLNLMAFRTKK